MIALEVLVVRANVDVLHRHAHDARTLLAHESLLVMRIGERVELAPAVGDFEQQDHVGVANERAPRLGVAERMRAREIHAVAEIDHRRLQRLRELDQELHAILVAHAAVGDDDRMLGSREPLRGLRERRALALRRARARELRDPDLVLRRLLLQLDVAIDDDRLHRRRGRDLVRAHGRLREMRKRRRGVVPLHEVAHERYHVLRGMVPFRAGTPLDRVGAVSREDHERHAIDPGVVDGHRAMLQAYGAVHERGHGLAGRLRVAVRHRDRRLFVHAGEELGLLVAAIVDERLLQAAEARAGVRRHVFEVERLDDVDHEIGAGALDDDVAWPLVIPAKAGIQLGPGLRRGDRGFLLRGLGRLRDNGRRAHKRCRCAGGFQECAPIQPRLLLFRHLVSPRACARIRFAKKSTIDL